MSENLIERISTALGSERTLEGFVRQLLEMLELVTDMESTYLTHIDDAKGLQHILYARNTQKMQIPEGLSVPWQDTLCKRAMEDGRSFTNDVPGVWPDSEAAKALGITTYLSTPVMLGDGVLYGTLCAASAQSHPLSDRAEQIIHLFAELIGQYIRKEQLLQELREANDALTAVSMTDELTGLPNRRSVFNHLPKLFAAAAIEERSVLVAFVDLDGFKAINDSYGHESGDRFLQSIAQRLRQFAGPEDIIGRLGGDEFIIASLGPQIDAVSDDHVQTFKAQLAEKLTGRYELRGNLIDYGGASLGVIAANPLACTPDLAVHDADSSMYQDKIRRRHVQH
ncbi:sensor domain-containing diguanylate cyclase [Erwinia sp. S38]|uniref:GGDEF domain-containing protein n=1 Tax=Erwinia sp. S38 TaxID=2769338 RepID=UPI00190B19BE|nr:sensor domain-containing diguanylate cyclase [Erwinia sp. S38]MBK0001483.1 sensor domain-containing diguanylate cyclase [Erwinia sp. S38]